MAQLAPPRSANPQEGERIPPASLSSKMTSIIARLSVLSWSGTVLLSAASPMATACRLARCRAEADVIVLDRRLPPIRDRPAIRIAPARPDPAGGIHDELLRIRRTRNLPAFERGALDFIDKARGVECSGEASQANVRTSGAAFTDPEDRSKAAEAMLAASVSTAPRLPSHLHCCGCPPGRSESFRMMRTAALFDRANFGGLCRLP